MNGETRFDDLMSEPDGMAFELRFEGEEPWATQKQMSDLFGIKQPTIAKHIRNIFDEQEVDEASNIQKMNIAGLVQARHDLQPRCGAGRRLPSWFGCQP